MTLARTLLVPAVLFALSGACARRSAQPDDSPATVTAASIRVPPDSPILGQVRCEPVHVADLPTDEITVPGKIEANPNRVSRVVVPVAGRVASVMVRVGDAVAAGQPLFALDSSDADAAVSGERQAQASLTQARAALDKARADAERTTDLFEHDAVARKDKLTADNAVTQAETTLAQADAALEQARRRLAVLGLRPGNATPQVVVRAPLAGKILDLTIVPGEFRNDTSAPVMTIADLRSVWVSSQVPETYIRFVQVDEPVEVRLAAYPGETFRARVSRIADTVDAQTRTVKVQAELDNRDGRLRPEMFGAVHHVESTARTAVVPVAAVIDEGDRSAVFVQSAPGVFDRRTVVLGKRAGPRVGVSAGLRAGERVVVEGALLLDNMMRKPA